MAMSQAARNARLAGCRPVAYFAPVSSVLETTEDAIARSNRVRAARDDRRLAAVAARPVAAAALVGSRYSGGFSATVRCR